MDREIAKTQEERKRMEKELASLNSLNYDKFLYGGTDKDSYVTSIPVNDEDLDNDDDNEVARKLASYTAPKSLLKEMALRGDEDEYDGGFRKPSRIIDREDDYRRRRLNRVLSPDRHDPFAMGDKTPDPSVRTYAEVMREEALKRETEATLREIAKKKKELEFAAPTAQKRRSRWDTGSDWDLPDGIGRWDSGANTTDVTPVGGIGLATPSPSIIQRGALTPDQYNLLRSEKDNEDRNRPLSDEELDAIFPLEGYKIVEPPASYVPIRTLESC